MKQIVAVYQVPVPERLHKQYKIQVGRYILKAELD